MKMRVLVLLAAVASLVGAQRPGGGGGFNGGGTNGGGNGGGGKWGSGSGSGRGGLGGGLNIDTDVNGWWLKDLCYRDTDKTECRSDTEVDCLAKADCTWGHPMADQQNSTASVIPRRRLQRSGGGGQGGQGRGGQGGSPGGRQPSERCYPASVLQTCGVVADENSCKDLDGCAWGSLSDRDDKIGQLLGDDDKDGILNWEDDDRDGDGILNKDELRCYYPQAEGRECAHIGNQTDCEVVVGCQFGDAMAFRQAQRDADSGAQPRRRLQQGGGTGGRGGSGGGRGQGGNGGGHDFSFDKFKDRCFNTVAYSNTCATRDVELDCLAAVDEKCVWGNPNKDHNQDGQEDDRFGDDDNDGIENWRDEDRDGDGILNVDEEVCFYERKSCRDMANQTTCEAGDCTWGHPNDSYDPSMNLAEKCFDEDEDVKRRACHGIDAEADCLLDANCTWAVLADQRSVDYTQDRCYRSAVQRPPWAMGSDSMSGSGSGATIAEIVNIRRRLQRSGGGNGGRGGQGGGNGGQGGGNGGQGGGRDGQGGGNGGQGGGNGGQGGGQGGDQCESQSTQTACAARSSCTWGIFDPFALHCYALDTAQRDDCRAPLVESDCDAVAGCMWGHRRIDDDEDGFLELGDFCVPEKDGGDGRGDRDISDIISSILHGGMGGGGSPMGGGGRRLQGGNGGGGRGPGGNGGGGAPGGDRPRTSMSTEPCADGLVCSGGDWDSRLGQLVFTCTEDDSADPASSGSMGSAQAPDPASQEMVQVTFCQSSPPQRCRMGCLSAGAGPKCAGADMCAMRQGSCCNYDCVADDAKDCAALCADKLQRLVTAAQNAIGTTQYDGLQDRFDLANAGCIKKCEIDGQDQQQVVFDSCTLAGGEVVDHAWTGANTANQYCNSCGCNNGLLRCTKVSCQALKTSSPSTAPVTSAPSTAPTLEKADCQTNKYNKKSKKAGAKKAQKAITKADKQIAKSAKKMKKVKKNITKRTKKNLDTASLEKQKQKLLDAMLKQEDIKQEAETYIADC